MPSSWIFGTKILSHFLLRTSSYIYIVTRCVCVCEHSCPLFLSVCESTINSKLHPLVCVYNTFYSLLKMLSNSMRTQLYAAVCWLHTLSAYVWILLAESANKVIWKKKKHLMSMRKKERAKQVSVSVFKKWECLHLRGGETKQRQKVEEESVFILQPSPKLSHCRPKQLWHWDLTWTLFTCENHVSTHFQAQCQRWNA